MSGASARRLAERMVELGMLDPAKSAEVLATIDEYSEPGQDAGTPIDLHDLAAYLPSFGVAVTIHVDDVDFVDEYYRSVFEEDVAAVTGGATVVTDVTLLEDEDGEEWLYFLRNGEPCWWAMEHQSHDYVDTLSVFENFNDFDPGGGDPRKFFLYNHNDPSTAHEQYWTFATREQALALREEFGLDFLGLDHPSDPGSADEAAEFLARWTSDIDERLRRWRRDFLPEGFPFDFSLESLSMLERLVVNRFPDGPAFKAAEAEPFVLGAVAYVGETLIRTGSGAWEYRVGERLYDGAPMVRSGQPIAFSALVVPVWLLGRLAEDRDLEVLTEAAEEFSDAARSYARALRALESDDEDIEDEDE